MIFSYHVTTCVHQILWKCDLVLHFHCYLKFRYISLSVIKRGPAFNTDRMSSCWADAARLVLPSTLSDSTASSITSWGVVIPSFSELKQLMPLSHWAATVSYHVCDSEDARRLFEGLTTSETKLWMWLETKIKICKHKFQKLLLLQDIYLNVLQQSH